MIVRTAHGERRVSPATYKLLLTAHIAISVGWLGATVVKLALGVSALAASNAVGTDGAATSAAVRPPGALYAAVSVVDLLFPPFAIATIVTGVLLSLGTRWGLLRHYWVVTKIVLTVAVPVTAVQISDRLLRASIAGPPGLTAADVAMFGAASAPQWLVAFAVLHALMLGTATILSVYKPWGLTPYGRRTRQQTVAARR